MSAKVHPSTPPLAPVHALHAAPHDPGRPPPGAQAGAGAPGQFRGSLFRPANAAARLPGQARGRSSSAGARARSAAHRSDEDGFGVSDDEAGPWGAASAQPVDSRGGDRDGSASDDERRQEHHLATANFSVGNSGAATALAAVPEWAAVAVADGGVQALLLRLTQRLMHSIDAAPAVPLHRRILGDVAAVLRAAGDRPLDIGGWPGVCTLLREASRMRGNRPSPPTGLVRRLNLMLPLLLHHLTRPRTPAQRAVLLARIDLACRAHPAPFEATHEP